MRSATACGVVVSLVFMSGCSQSQSQYDALRDETSISASVYLRQVMGHDGGDTGNCLWFNLTGKGKRPSEWRVAISLELDNIPVGKPPILGDRAMLKIAPFTELEDIVMPEKGYRDGVRNERAMWSTGLKIDDLVHVAEGNDLSVNGQPITLAREQRDKIRQAVIEARQLSAR